MGMRLSETRSFIIQAAKRAALTPGAGAHEPNLDAAKQSARTHSFTKAARRDLHQEHLKSLADVNGPNTRVSSQFGNSSGVGVTARAKGGAAGCSFSRTRRF